MISVLSQFRRKLLGQRFCVILAWHLVGVRVSGSSRVCRELEYRSDSGTRWRRGWSRAGLLHLSDIGDVT